MILKDLVIFKIFICDDNDDDLGIFIIIILTRIPSVNTLIIISTLVTIIIIIIILPRFPSVDTLISEVPGSGWMSRSETAK